ncbi:MAG: bestrophin family ion channel [Waterburya sp.]
MKARKLLIKMAVWLITEITFNLMGIDELIDYSEFIFEQNLANQEKKVLLTEDSIMAIRKQSKFGKREKLAAPQVILSKSRNSNASKFLSSPQASQQELVSPRSIREKQPNKRQIIFQSAKAIFPQVLPWIALCSTYGLFISLLNRWELLPEVFLSQAIALFVVGLTIALGSLLTLRINTACKSFYLGRRPWLAMMDLVNNQIRGIWHYVEEQEPQYQYEKESAIQLVSALAVATKLHLQQQPMTELKPLLSQLEYKRLQVSKNAPLDIIFWLSDYLERQYKQGQLDAFQYSYLQSGVERLTDILGDCERVAKKSAPLIYTIALKVFLIAYLIVLPIGIMSQLGLGTTFVMLLVSSIYLLMNEVATEIEQPFNQYRNQYLDSIYNTIKRNVENLMQSGSRPQAAKIRLDLPKKVA